MERRSGDARPGERFPYELVSNWRVRGRIADVYAILSDGASLPRWWPAAYSEVREVARGGPDGRGRIEEIVTRGVLPYAVRWRLEVTETRAPELIRLVASGDLVGRGEWRLVQEGAEVALAYDWRVRTGKPWMRQLEFLMKPLFVLNHNWVMRRGEAGLREELPRRAGEAG